MPDEDLTFEYAVERAHDAFWAELHRTYRRARELEHGDVDPLEHVKFTAQCEKAVRSLFRANLGLPVENTRYRLKHRVDRFPHFSVPAGSVGMIAYDETGDHVRLCMDDFVEGAEEWDNEIVWSIEDDYPDGVSPLYAFLEDCELVTDPAEVRP